jgi:hypothetical protein
MVAAAMYSALQDESAMTFCLIVSASSPLVGFSELNDNAITGLISLLSVE